MKEIKRLRDEMLEAPGWTKRKSVEIAVFSAEVCVQRYHLLGGEDRRAHGAIDAVKQYLVSGNTGHLKEKAQEMRETEALSASGCGWGGEAAYFATRATLFAVEAARKKSEKKAAKSAAKAVDAAAMSKGWENPTYEGGMVDNYCMVEEDYTVELKRLRKHIKSL